MAVEVTVAGSRPGCGDCAFWSRSKDGWGLCEVARVISEGGHPAIAGGATDAVGELGWGGLVVVARTREEYTCIFGEFGG